MRKVIFVLGGALFFFAANRTYGEEVAPLKAQAELINSKGEKVGRVTLNQEGGRVKISVEVSKLSPGLHAFHIHTVGKCDPPDFATAGSHFNPYGKKHGTQNHEGPHAGDLPNLLVGGDGTGETEISSTDVTLREGVNSLLSPQGTAFILHANPDDNQTDPSGKAGERIACGVITSSKE